MGFWSTVHEVCWDERPQTGKTDLNAGSEGGYIYWYGVHKIEYANKRSLGLTVQASRQLWVLRLK